MRAQLTTWQPILHGTLGDRATATIRAIADALLRRLDETDDPADDLSAARHADLPSGFAGLALLFAALYRAGYGQQYLHASAHCIDTAIDEVAAAEMSAGFLGGFTGIAWAAQQLQHSVFNDTDDDLNQSIDAALLDWLAHTPWPWEYDLVSGLVGVGVYALDRLVYPSGQPLLERVIQQLEDTSQNTTDGIAWHTAPHLLPHHQRQICPGGYYNLGMAHGIPGVIALLGEVAATGVAHQRARALLHGAVNWLLACRLAPDDESAFPFWIADGARPRPARAAWCYGDPGIAVALLRSARFVNNTVWERDARRIAHAAAARPPERTGVVDAGLCHGAAGLAHLFNRLYHATGEVSLHLAAIAWFKRTLEMRQPRQGIAGFLARKTDPQGHEIWAAEPGILNGAAGIALALLAATTSSPPTWDKMMLLPIPGRRTEAR